MPAATNKTDLISVTEKDWEKLLSALEKVNEELASKKVDGVSIKDVTGHRAHWIELFLGWYSDGLAGKQVFMPAKGYKWNELNAYNAKLREDQAGFGFDAAKNLLVANHGKMLAFLEGCSDADLYGAPMAGGNGKWTAGRFAEASGASHYRSATKFIRKCLRDAA